MRKSAARFFLGMWVMMGNILSLDAVFSDEKLDLIVKFKSGISEERQQEVLSQLKLKAITKLELIGAITCRYEGTSSVRELISEGNQFSEIEYLEPDYVVHTQ